MRLGRIEIVVEIERMGDRAIDQRGPRRGQSLCLAEDGARPRAPWRHHAEQLFGHRLDRAGHHHRHGIDEFAVRPLARVLRPDAGNLRNPAAIDVERIAVHVTPYLMPTASADIPGLPVSQAAPARYSSLFPAACPASPWANEATAEFARKLALPLAALPCSMERRARKKWCQKRTRIDHVKY